MSENIYSKFKSIKHFILDVDGVLTDGSLTITEKGELLRTMNAKDGMAMRLALDNGYTICIITGGKSAGVIKRLKGLGIKEIHVGIYDKLECFEELKDIYEWKKEEILYVGDDINDYEVMQAVGLACCPKDAVPEIKSISQYISTFEGGKGCVRDVVEKVLKLNSHWMQ